MPADGCVWMLHSDGRYHTDCGVIATPIARDSAQDPVDPLTQRCSYCGQPIHDAVAAPEQTAASTSCSNCHREAFSFNEIRNAHGEIVVLACEHCHAEATSVIEAVDRRFGAHIVNGTYLAGPVGSPHYHSLDEARSILAQQAGATST